VGSCGELWEVVGVCNRPVAIVLNLILVVAFFSGNVACVEVQREMGTEFHSHISEDNEQ